MTREELVAAVREYVAAECPDWTGVRLAVRNGEKLVRFLLIEPNEVTSLRLDADQAPPAASP